jgi:hypothetical protein
MSNSASAPISTSDWRPTRLDPSLFLRVGGRSMRLVRLSLGALALAAAALGPAHAQDAAAPAKPAPAPAQAIPAAPPPPTPGDPGPVRLKLARRILDDIGTANLTAMMDSIINSLTSAMMTNSALTPQMKKAAQEAASETMGDMVPAILDDVARIYAKDFDEAQLTDIAAFYESPTGRALVAKLPEIGRQSGQVGMELLPAIQADIVQRFCKKVSCGPDQMKTLQPQIG